MPIFTYICKSCSKKFDILVGMTQDKPDLRCPDCGSAKVEKGFASFRVSSGSGSSVSGSSAGGCSSCSGGDCSSCSH